MAEMITDLETIARLAQRNERKDFAFRSFLKGELDWSSRKLDALVHEIYRSVTSEIDCTECGHCCRVMMPSLHPGDAERLAQRFGTDTQEFEDRYVIADEFGEQALAETPCPFHDGMKCTVYEDRPRDCRDYPHLHKKDFSTRLLAVLENAEICPIVFNVLEQLKERFNWR
jgi:uncharacterized protein